MPHGDFAWFLSILQASVFPVARMVMLMLLATAKRCAMATGLSAGKETGELALHLHHAAPDLALRVIDRNVSVHTLFWWT